MFKRSMCLPLCLSTTFRKENNFCDFLFVSFNDKKNIEKERLLLKESTVELQWLERLWDYENLFEKGMV